MAESTPADVSGGPTCLAALHATHAPELRRFVLGILRDRAAADDVVQAVFAKAIDAVGQLPADAVKPWLFRVACNEAITWKRRARVAHKAISPLGERAKQREPETVDTPLVRAETVTQVREAMQTLSAEQHRVVEARIYEEKTFARIAAEMGLPLGTVLTHMRRALEKLKRKLDRHE